MKKTENKRKLLIGKKTIQTLHANNIPAGWTPTTMNNYCTSIVDFHR
jgi:hypothetical protein